MRVAKDDRRSKRTRQLLGNALVELMLEKRFDTITVQDILDRANVGRSTFYEHYADKEDLLMSEIVRVIHALREKTAASGHADGILLPSLEFFRHIQEYRRLLHAFVARRGAEFLIKDFETQLSKVAEDNLHTMFGTVQISPMTRSVTSRFIGSTFLMLVRWWFENDMHQSPDEMDAIFQRLVMPGVQAMLDAQT